MSDELESRQKPANSILDRVLSSQHAQAIEGFVPTEVFTSLVKTLSDKESDVLRRRFGLHGDEPETLEKIGTLYHVTRERIRQIENIAVQHIKNSKNSREVIVPVERMLVSILNAHGGIMEEHAFFQETLSHAGNTPEQQRSLVFILTQLLPHRIEHRAADQIYRTNWRLKAQSLDLVEHTISEMVTIIKQRATPLKRNELLAAFRERALYKQHSSWFSDEVILSYAILSVLIGRNPFGEYGLTSWGTILPKRMNDKIYLILKKHEKPLHFTEIARRINEAGFDHRRAFPPTVHNELILNKHYVLVGRGIYALREWGYKPGVVAEVLIDILKKQGRPMTRDELVDQVLKQRMVKRNTVLLALTNKQLFRRSASGEYELASSPNKQP